MTASTHEGLLHGAKYSIRKKLMMVVLSTTLVALLIASGAMVVYELRSYRLARVADLLAQAALIARASAPALSFDDMKEAQANLNTLDIVPTISTAAVYTAKGRLFASYVRRDIVDAKFPELPQATGYQVVGNQLYLFEQMVEDGQLLGTVYLSARYELFERLKDYASILAVVMTLSMFGAVLMAGWLRGVFSRPILDITSIARQVVTQRDFSLRARRTTEDEIGYLVDAFNDMLAEIGRRAQALETSNRALLIETDERRDAERALLVADQRKDEFLATLAHELRNPLAPLRNGLEILRRGGRDGEALKDVRDMMERQLNQLVRLVNDLLDISRITTGKMVLKKARVELKKVVASALETAAPLIEARGHHLNISLPSEPVFLCADFTRLAQVFLNLLNNASKFTDPGGNIAIEAQTDDAGLTVTVTDSGIGIDATMLPVIFDMFAQADRSLEQPQAGLGVGLTLVKTLVELHGGTIKARSAGLGHGSEFTIRLPTLNAQYQDSGESVAVAETKTGVSRRIFLVDDNRDFADSMAMLLNAMGHEVRVAHDGLGALAIAAEFKPDFAFLDIGLPQINGYELARRLHSSNATRRTVLVAITGWGQETDRRASREAGFLYHLVKPVEPEAILKILNESPPS